MEPNSPKPFAKIISNKDLFQAIEFINSNTVEWHTQRQATLHSDYPRTTFNKQQHFVVSKIDIGTDV
jgi:hypothetical protein